MSGLGPIIRGVAYAVERTADGVALVITTDMISFRREVIPDGVLAGRMGHLEMPHERVERHELSPGEARRIWAELGQVLDALGVPR